MSISIFLAKVIGLYFVIVSLPFIFNAKQLRSITEGLIENQALLVLSSIIAIILGILLVLSHNIWVADWRIIITIIAWITLIKGVIGLYVPNMHQRFSRRFQNITAYRVMSIITFLIGVGLLYLGFMMH